MDQDQVLDESARSPLVASIIVYGAGDAAVNGLYLPDGRFNGLGKFSKSGFWKDEECVFSLAADILGNGVKEWFISIIDDDIDFYCGGTCTAMHSLEIPPTSGWRTCRDVDVVFGNVPAPKLKYCRQILGNNATIEPSHEKLLFSSKFSDVTIVCAGGEEVPAHKMILAEVSQYFDSMFSGPWKEAQKGRLQTVYSAGIMKELLSMFYTGKLDKDVILQDPSAWMGVAHEYCIDWLFAVAEDSCIHFFLLHHCSISDLWQVGFRFDSAKIMSVCLLHAKKSPIDVLMTSGFQRLRVEGPESWNSFSEAIAKQKTGA